MFARKLINVEVQLASGSATQMLSGFRVEATIDRKSGPDNAAAEISIYGLPLNTMNTLSRVGTQSFGASLNKVALYAWEEGVSQPQLAFTGQIFEAYVDAQSPPQVAFRINAGVGGGYWAVAPTKPISLPGSQSAASMLSQLASTMGLSFENNGVNSQLMNPYYPGNPWTQAREIARHVNADLWIDKGVMAITPAGQPRQAKSVPLISKDTIEVGYPSFRQVAVVVKCTWSPSIVAGGPFMVQSDVTPANGTWTATHIIDEIASLVPHGPWFSYIEGVSPTGSPVSPS